MIRTQIGTRLNFIEDEVEEFENWGALGYKIPTGNEDRLTYMIRKIESCSIQKTQNADR